MIVKPNKPVIFATDLYWSSGGNVIVSSHSANRGIPINTTTNISSDSEWGPEQLLLGAIISSLLNTYLDLSKRMKLETISFECTATAQTDIIDGKVRITFIHIYPKAFVSSEPEVEKALVALEKAKKLCPLYYSINADIVQHPEAAVVKKKNEAA